MNRFSLILAALLLTLALAVPAAATTPPPAANNRATADQINAFGLDLARQILTTQAAQGNVVVSPYSISCALLMTYNGALGKTRDEMARVLHLAAPKLELVNPAQLQLKQAIESADPKVTLAVANSLWANREIEFSRAFMERNEQFFAAEVQALDFLSQDAAQTINAWVSRQTRDKIPTIVDEVPQDAILYLINAVYFYGQWSEQFDKQDTMPAEFTLLDGNKVQRPQMRQRGEYAYLENERFQAAALPYGDGAFSMLIILPCQDDGLAGLQADLNAETWQGWISELRTAEGSILLPRFKVEYANELSDELKALGMGAAFDKQRADFKAMLADPRPEQVVYISLVKHKTFIEVNEQGTEAAAVTSVEIKMTTAMPNEPEPFLLRVDHPFLFAIVHEQSGTLLFLGSIVDPTE